MVFSLDGDRIFLGLLLFVVCFYIDTSRAASWWQKTKLQQVAMTRM